MLKKFESSQRKPSPRKEEDVNTFLVDDFVEHETRGHLQSIRAEASPTEIEANPPGRDVPETATPPPAAIPAVVAQLLMFGGPLESVSRRKAARRPPSTVTTSDQLGSFQS